MLNINIVCFHNNNTCYEKYSIMVIDFLVDFSTVH
jgi:hypothetical protein